MSHIEETPEEIRQRLKPKRRRWPWVVLVLVIVAVAGVAMSRSSNKEVEGPKWKTTSVSRGDIELKRWILAWGRYCKVKSPRWVKQMINNEVHAMLS